MSVTIDERKLLEVVDYYNELMEDNKSLDEIAENLCVNYKYAWKETEEEFQAYIDDESPFGLAIWLKEWYW